MPTKKEFGNKLNSQTPVLDAVSTVEKGFSSSISHMTALCASKGLSMRRSLVSNLSIFDNTSELNWSTDRLEKYGLRMRRKSRCTLGSDSVVKLWGMLSDW